MLSITPYLFDVVFALLIIAILLLIITTIKSIIDDILKERRYKKMEGNKIYEDSLNELKQIKKHLSSDSVVISMKNLDENTREEMTKAIQNVIANRYSKVESVVLGVK